MNPIKSTNSEETADTIISEKSGEMPEKIPRAASTAPDIGLKAIYILCEGLKEK